MSKINITQGMRFKIAEATYESLEECGGCGSWHPKDWHGDCRDDSHRMHPDDLISLLESAPDMLEALETARPYIGTGSVERLQYIQNMIDRVVNKAKGGTT